MEKISLKLEKSKEKITSFGGAILVGDVICLKMLKRLGLKEVTID